MENYPQWNLPEKAEARLGKGSIWAMQFSPDGTQLAVSCPTGVWFYDVKTGKEVSLFTGRRGSLAFSPDGRFLAKGGEQFQMWEIATQREVPLQDDLPDTNVLRFSNDSKTLVYLSDSGDKICRLDVETGKNTEIKLQKEATYIHPNECALTDDKIAIGSGDGRLELWNTTTGEKLSTLRKMGKKVIMPDYFTRTNHAITMEFSLDGTRLATGNLDTTIQIWDTTSGEELIVLQTATKDSNMWFMSRGNGKVIVHNPMKDQGYDRPSTLAFSSDGLLLACGSEDSTVKLWNTMNGELFATFTGHLSNVEQLTFSPDGNILASRSADGTVQFWDIEMRKALTTKIVGHLWISTASFFDGGSKLTSVSNEGIITNWDLKNSQKTTLVTKATLEEPLYWRTCRNLVLSPDGTILANDGIQNDPSNPNFGEYVLRLTDVRTGRELETFPNSYLTKFSPNGKTAACSGGNTIRLLNMEIGEEGAIIIAEEPDDDTITHTPELNAFEFSPDGKKIVSGTKGGLVQLWDVETGIELSSFFEEQPPIDENYQEPITTFAFSSDGSLIAVGSGERIRILGSSNVPHFKEVSATGYVYDDILVFSPDDNVLLRSLDDGGIQLWDVATGEKFSSLDGYSESIKDLKFSPDNKTLMSVGGGNILLWDWDKVLSSARGKDAENTSEQNLPVEEKPTENVLQFLEHSPQKPKTSEYMLWKGEVYLANEWFDAALEEFMKYLTAADHPGDRDVTTHPSFHRKLFTRIGKACKDVHDKERYVNMLNELIEYFNDSLSIQLNAHLVLAKFYHDNDMLEKADVHFQQIDSVASDLSSERLSLQVNVYLSIAGYYHDSEMFDKVDEHIQKIEDIAAELDPNDHFSLRLLLDTHFDLAEYYWDHGNLEKADGYIQKTGFVTEDAWMVLGPFDNVNGVGFDAAYIPEVRTEIDLSVKHDGLNGLVRWKKFTDAELDGYIHLGEKDADWQISYAFATVTSPDEREVQFRFDSDDQGKVWLNGKEVFSHTKAFMAIVDTYTIPVTLKPGENSILVKVCNEMGGWGFYLRITDKDGRPFDDLTINTAIQNAA